MATDVDVPAVTDTHNDAVPVLRAWDAPAPRHGFFSRLGGVSTGEFASLNLSRWVGDHPAAVDENWRRVRPIIGAARVIALVNQVHGAAVRVVTRANASERPAADGMVTVEPDLTLGIFTADCVPILAHHRLRGVVGAFHAGWRGIEAGIVDAGINAMCSLGATPRDVRVALGPSIGPCCFEVDADLAARFAREMPDADRRTRDGRPGKAYLDLRGIVRDALERAGIGDVTDVGPCTRCASDRFFSRRAAGGVTIGLQLSFISRTA